MYSVASGSYRTALKGRVPTCHPSNQIPMKCKLFLPLSLPHHISFIACVRSLLLLICLEAMKASLRGRDLHSEVPTPNLPSIWRARMRGIVFYRLSARWWVSTHHIYNWVHTICRWKVIKTRQNPIELFESLPFYWCALSLPPVLLTAIVLSSAWFFSYKVSI